jgi:hypothetical protein
MTVDITIEQAEVLIRRMTDGLVNIKDESGEFLEKRELRADDAHALTCSRYGLRCQLKDVGRMGVDTWSRVDRISQREL